MRMYMSYFPRGKLCFGMFGQNLSVHIENSEFAIGLTRFWAFHLDRHLGFFHFLLLYRF